MTSMALGGFLALGGIGYADPTFTDVMAEAGNRNSLHGFCTVEWREAVGVFPP
jgi:hypothetical protein